MELNIGLEARASTQIGQSLGLILADMYVLYVKTQNFHWNLIDVRFYSLHKLLEEQYKELAKFIDEVAERIRMLGERTPATMKQFLDMTSFQESQGDLITDEMLNQLLKDHEALIRHLRDRIEYTSKLGDEGTADLLTQLIRFHEKTAWMLRSHFNGSL